MKAGYCLHILLYSLSLVFTLSPPLNNWVTITLHTDRRTWHEAESICQATGGELYSPTFYSLFISPLDFVFHEPWSSVPVKNGDEAWIGLHNKITVIGDEIYSLQCNPLSEFLLPSWNSPDSLPDGDADARCVHDQIYAGYNEPARHDYTKGHCLDRKPFYCQYQTGPCQFVEHAGYLGDTHYDFTPDNDLTIGFTNFDDCKTACLTEIPFLVSNGFKVIEECWGFSITSTKCILHVVGRPNYFDFSGRMLQRYYSTLHVKTCFEAAVNHTVYDDITADDSSEPNRTCGIPEYGNSTMIPRPVYVFTHPTTWNTAFMLCKENQSTLLNIDSDIASEMLSKLISKYMSNGFLSEGTLWLGQHEPDPQHYPDIRLQSDCTDMTYTNWDSNQQPTTDLYDISLCTVLDTASLTWRTAQCNESHPFICMGTTDTVSSHWVYNGPQSNVIGEGTGLGPYHVTQYECENQCSVWTYNETECWAYAYMLSGTSSHNCYIYFAEDPLFYYSNFDSVPDPYKFYRKQAWTDHHIQSTTNTADNSVFPYSCCDPSTANVTYVCPSTVVPSNNPSIPTTSRQHFVLFTSHVTWNTANTVCSSVGARLLQIDTLSKRQAIEYFLEEWWAQGLIMNSLWTGLVQTNKDDSCSLKWEKDCSVPEWLETGDDISNSGSADYCWTVQSSGTSLQRAPCNDTHQFICEKDSDTCEMRQVYEDEMCSLSNTDYVSANRYTCESTCLTYVYDGRECWGIVHTTSKCYLILTADPFHFQKTRYDYNGRDMQIKLCFTSSVNNSVLEESSSTTDIYPSSQCTRHFSFPYVPDESHCTEQAVGTNSQPLTSSVSDSSSTTKSSTTSSEVLPTLTSSVSESSLSGKLLTTSSVVTSIPNTMTSMASEHVAFVIQQIMTNFPTPSEDSAYDISTDYTARTILLPSSVSTQGSVYTSLFASLFSSTESSSYYVNTEYTDEAILSPVSSDSVAQAVIHNSPIINTALSITDSEHQISIEDVEGTSFSFASSDLFTQPSIHASSFESRPLTVSDSTHQIHNEYPSERILSSKIPQIHIEKETLIYTSQVVGTPVKETDSSHDTNTEHFIDTLVSPLLSELIPLSLLDKSTACDSYAVSSMSTSSASESEESQPTSVNDLLSSQLSMTEQNYFSESVSATADAFSTPPLTFVSSKLIEDTITSEHTELHVYSSLSSVSRELSNVLPTTYSEILPQTSYMVENTLSTILQSVEISPSPPVTDTSLSLDTYSNSIVDNTNFLPSSYRMINTMFSETTVSPESSMLSILSLLQVSTNIPVDALETNTTESAGHPSGTFSTSGILALHVSEVSSVQPYLVSLLLAAETVKISPTTFTAEQVFSNPYTLSKSISMHPAFNPDTSQNLTASNASISQNGNYSFMQINSSQLNQIVTLSTVSTPPINSTHTIQLEINIIYIWPCLCNPYNDTTEAGLYETSYNKKSLSKYQRSLKCAPDDRTSSLSIGVLALSLLVAVSTCMFLLDLPQIIQFMLQFHFSYRT